MKTSWIPEIKTQTQQQKDGHWPCTKETHPSHMFDSADLWCFRRRRLRNLQVRSLRGQGNSSYSIDLYCCSRSACAKQVPKNIEKHPKTSKNIEKHIIQPQHVFTCANSTSSTGVDFAAGGAAFVEASPSGNTPTATQNHLQLLRDVLGTNSRVPFRLQVP